MQNSVTKSLEAIMKVQRSGTFINKDGQYCVVSTYYVGTKKKYELIYALGGQPARKLAICTFSEKKIIAALEQEEYTLVQNTVEATNNEAATIQTEAATIEAAEQDAIAAEQVATETAAQAPKNHLAFYYVQGIEELIGAFTTRAAAVNALAEMHRANIVLQAVATELRRCDKMPTPPVRKAYVPMPTLAETYSKPNDIKYILERLAERIEKFRAEAKQNIAAAQAQIPRSKTADDAYDVAQTTRQIIADIQVQDLEVQADLEAIASVITSVFTELYSYADNADSEAHAQLDALQLEEDQHENIVLRG